MARRRSGPVGGCRPSSSGSCSKAHRAKLVKALKYWPDNLSEEERAALAERSRQTLQERWASMSKRECDARLGRRPFASDGAHSPPAFGLRSVSPSVDPCQSEHHKEHGDEAYWDANPPEGVPGHERSNQDHDAACDEDPQHALARSFSPRAVA